ncbi:MAG: hypothetical protein LBF01_00765, partial [Bacteroidales bacterium]|nr:hypothetical protein [Bacteroidales bacterium]
MKIASKNYIIFFALLLITANTFAQRGRRGNIRAKHTKVVNGITYLDTNVVIKFTNGNTLYSNSA